MEREDEGQEEQEEQQALERDEREGLVGDTEENRNLSGSTTWETLPDQGPQDDEDEEPQG